VFGTSASLPVLGERGVRFAIMDESKETLAALKARKCEAEAVFCGDGKFDESVKKTVQSFGVVDAVLIFHSDSSLISKVLSFFLHSSFDLC
jgi:hypothetical protein